MAKCWVLNRRPIYSPRSRKHHANAEAKHAYLRERGGQAHIPNSTFWIQRRSRNFHTRSFRLKVGPTPKCRFKPYSTTGLGISSETPGSERRVILDQTRHSGTNRAVRIFIRARLPKMLTKVNCWPNFELKNTKSGSNECRKSRDSSQPCS